MPWLDCLQRLTGLLCQCNTDVVCVRYGLIGALVILHDCGTHGTPVLAFLNQDWVCMANVLEKPIAHGFGNVSTCHTCSSSNSVTLNVQFHM